ncbi:hypothetical protein [Sulfitobacter sp. SK012]|uniref:hypothetical protein n=1 Tax=Sulfitobacter sp. SK012 TaxID=1389005 RepID=UPI0013B37301|nr:hypothetical protein [Sulfitobacter sp. SK012]
MLQIYASFAALSLLTILFLSLTFANAGPRRHSVTPATMPASVIAAGLTVAVATELLLLRHGGLSLTCLGILVVETVIVFGGTTLLSRSA